jgi:small nuclear ribonucleoprotein (snRNP)-like protein
MSTETYDAVINKDYEIKMNFVKQYIDPEKVFIEIHNGEVYHILLHIDQEIRLVVFNEDEFSKFINGGSVIAFNDNHKQLNYQTLGLQKIRDYIKDSLPQQKYNNFEKWALMYI